MTDTTICATLHGLGSTYTVHVDPELAEPYNCHVQIGNRTDPNTPRMSFASCVAWAHNTIAAELAIETGIPQPTLAINGETTGA